MSWILSKIHERIAERQAYFDALLTGGKTYQVYHEVNQIALDVGSKYGVQVFLNFPNAKSIHELKSLNSRGISIIVDNSRKKFSNYAQDEVRDQLSKRFLDARLVPVGFGHEGFHVDFKSGRLTVLPSGVHIWRELDLQTKEFLDWLFFEFYRISDDHPD
jgi:hypothetical protein